MSGWYSLMDDFMLKKRGRLNINKLDWLLAITCCVIAVASIWMSIGISVFGAGQGAADAFLIFLRGLAFIDSFDYGSCAVISLLTSILFWGSVVYVVAGFLYLNQHDQKDRRVGLFVELVAMFGFLALLAFVYEFLGGTYSFQLPAVWPSILIVFLVALVGIMGLSIYATFRFSVDLSLPNKEEKKPEPAKEAE